MPSSSDETEIRAISSDRHVTAILNRRVLAQRYELHELIGQGGFGSVYKAHDRSLHRTVAAKLLHQESRSAQLIERFRREAVVLAQFTAPEIVPIYDYGTDGEDFFIIMQFVEGETLSSRLQREKPLELHEAIAITKSICGLIAAHERNIVHRDLKPSNIILTEGFATRLLDFGISKQLDSDNLTQSVVVGTPMYMSPEQARAERIDGRSDLFSVGCMLFEMLTGRRPFDTRSFAGYLVALMHERPNVSLLVDAAVPAEIVQIVRRCLEKNPARRFQSAQELLDALQATATDEQQPIEANVVNALKALAWPAFATASVIICIAILSRSLAYAAWSLALLPLLWVGRRYWRYLHWQYAVLLFSISTASFVFLWDLPIFAHVYQTFGQTLPLVIRRFIQAVYFVTGWGSILIVVTTIFAAPLLRRHGYTVVRVLNAAPSRVTAFLLALVAMGLLAWAFRQVSSDALTMLQTRNMSGADLDAARDEAAQLMRSRAPLTTNAVNGLVDSRLRFGRLFLESGLPLETPQFAKLFTAIPAAAEHRKLGLIGTYKWWAIALSRQPEAAFAAWRALNKALDMAADPELLRLQLDMELRAGRYATATEILRRRALDSQSVIDAQGVVALLASRDRCAEARSFIGEFVGRYIAAGNDAKQLPDLIASCRGSKTGSGK